MQKVLFSIIFIAFLHTLQAQGRLSVGPNIDSSKKQLVAVHLDGGSITVDGDLEDEAWQRAAVAEGFTTLEPVYGRQASQRTEVKIMYNDIGVYIGARMYDTSPDSILRELSERDNLNNTDWFLVAFSPYNDGINGQEFLVSSANVQFDAKLSNVSGEDVNWDAVWKSSTKIDHKGWMAEMFIPFAALRFPEIEDQVWQVNFCRMIQRRGEKVFWSKVDPKVDGFINQSGYLTGLHNLQTPLRLQASPYVAAYFENYHDPNAVPRNVSGRSLTGGMDIKYGISDAFTLDMTLIPDFGEATSDNQVLNLSPFEVRFDENRPFFMEGTELFNKGGFFYSRRVGGQPFNNQSLFNSLQEGEELVSNPSQVGLLNAIKLSGRNQQGLGLGLFNAIAGREFAVVRHIESGEERSIQTNPLTNYTVAVLDQSLPHNSYATLINTTVLREGSAYDANVTGALFDLRDKNNNFSINGKVGLSQKFQENGTNLGYTHRLSFRKVSGKFTYSTGYMLEDDQYDPNDLGFLYNNNEKSIWINGQYSFFELIGPFNRFNVGVEMRHGRLFRPNEKTANGVNWWMGGQLKNLWHINLWGYHEPWGSRDYFEPRIWGLVQQEPAYSNIGFWMGTDRRKKLYVSLNGNFSNYAEKGWNGYNRYIGLRYRFNDKLSLESGNFFDKTNNQRGFAGFNYSDSGKQQSIFGLRNQETIENSLSLNYKFSANMILTTRARHYWSQVSYDGFFQLLDDSSYSDTEYSQNNNSTFNSFNVDLIYRWRFAPGSDIFLVWKNKILHGNNLAEMSYLDDLSGLFELPQTNSISLKVIYFLDYAEIARSKASKQR